MGPTRLSTYVQWQRLNHFTNHFARRVLRSAVDHVIGDHSDNHFVRKLFFTCPSIIFVSIIFNRSFWVDHFQTIILVGDHFSGKGLYCFRIMFQSMCDLCIVVLAPPTDAPALPVKTRIFAAIL